MHKKLLSVLLALVMILSVLPMAAFAEEAEHTHDETCGCVTTLAVCAHSSYTDIGESTDAEYLNVTNHKRNYYDVRKCNICGETFTHLVSWNQEWHNEKYGYKYIGTVYVEGELCYRYEVYCECGYTYYRDSSIAPT